jgi:hypothetical protein
MNAKRSTAPTRRMTTITYDWLRRHGACEEQRDLAALHFGHSAPLTRQTLTEAAALGLDVDWLASHLLTPAQWDAYEAGRALLWTAYVAGRATLLATEAGRAPLLATYEAGRAPLLATEAGRAPLRATYEAGVATLLADLLGLP